MWEDERVDSYLALRDIIYRLMEDLTAYAKKENSNQYYIDKQNKLVTELTTIYNSISDLQYYDLWIAVEAKMAELQRRDKSITGHLVQIRTKQHGNNFTIIKINPYG